MQKINLVIILVAAFLTAGFLAGSIDVKADDNAVVPGNQVLKDEGYGNEDAEYYNSEDDRVNDEDVSSTQNETSGNDVQ